MVGSDSDKLELEDTCSMKRSLNNEKSYVENLIEQIFEKENECIMKRFLSAFLIHFVTLSDNSYD